MPDQSQQQLEAITKLRAALSAPQKEATLQEKVKEAQQRQEQFNTKIKQAQDLQLQRLKVSHLQNILKNSINPKERDSAGKELIKLLMEAGGGSTPPTETPIPSGGVTNFRKVR
jgi:hypothetical protein